ncbi:putative isoaspartyl peptidase/L-asparaginase 3 [Diplonema papillatum]|nr:putative isoaspartyl peptidase/L-asparaginase 3 [Diplonema papillatum]
MFHPAGAGSYVDSDVGGAACTGDGDVMLRFSPSYQAVEYMRQGLAPTEACRRALARVAAKYPSFSGAMVCLSRNGSHGGAKHNFDPFAYSLRTEDMRETHVVPVEPVCSI